MRLIYHKGWRLTTSTGELECMAWDIMLKFFYIDLLYYQERHYFVRSCFLPISDSTGTIIYANQD